MLKYQSSRKNSIVVNTVSRLKMLSEKLMKVKEFAFDTETNTLLVYGPRKESKCVDITISWGDYDNYIIPVNHVYNYCLPKHIITKYLKPSFERTDITLIGHNLLFDMSVMYWLMGIRIKTHKLFDTEIASWICDENREKGLKANTQQILGIDQTHIKDVFSTVTAKEKKENGLKANNKATFDLVRLDVGAPYALDDSYFTWNLYLYYLDMLEEEEMDKIYYKTYPPFLHTLFNMSLKGIPVDTEKLKDIGEHIQQDLDELLYKMIEITGVEFEPSSRQHLCQLLFGYSEGFKTPRTDLLDKSFHFPIQGTTKTGQPQTGVEVLKYLAKNPKKYTSKRKLEGIEVCKLLIEYSKLDKLKTSFVDGIFKTIYDDGKCHPQYQPVGTDSGRISCSKPNLMQLPNADEEEDKYLIRDCFIGSVDENTGKRNHIISIDYSNLEVRVMAHFSQDEGLIKAFNEGKDLHGNTAKLMFRLACDANEVKKKYPDLRQQGKVIAFLLQYGGSSYTLYDDLNKDGALDNMAKQVQECYDKGIPLPSELEPFKGCTKGKDIAQRLMDIYFEAFPGIARFMRSQKKYAHRHKYVYKIGRAHV